MAGDWIKVEHGLPNKPEVMQLAELLGINELEVVGHLVLFWTWVDQNLSPDCPAVNGTRSGLDRVAQRDGFATAMVTVGWLSVDGGRISIPNYDHHLSESAKKRALDTRKKQRQRNLSRKCPADVPQATGQNGGPKAVREEKSIKSTYTEKELDGWDIPERLNTGEVRELLEEFEDMRRKIKKPIKSLTRASRVLIQFDDVEHLVFALTTCVANDYQGLKPEYRPTTNGKLNGRKKLTALDFPLPIEDGS